MKQSMHVMTYAHRNCKSISSAKPHPQPPYQASAWSYRYYDLQLLSRSYVKWLYLHVTIVHKSQNAAKLRPPVLIQSFRVGVATATLLPRQVRPPQHFNQASIWFDR